MLNRRAFLWASSASALAAGVPSLDAQQRQPAPGAVSMPPSIASLTSMKANARPITTDERRGRIEKARRLMTEHRIDALMLTGGTSLNYFTNVRWGLSERLLAVILPAKGEAFVVSPAFEEERAREQLANGPLTAADVLTWEEDEDPYALVVQGLRRLNVGTGRLGVEETVRYVFSDGVSKAGPGLQLMTGTPVTAGCRGVKDAHEIELMRLAARVTRDAYQAAWKALAPGMTQADVGRLIAQAHQQLGFPGGASVQVGKFSALPHGSTTPQVVREGEVVLIDGGCNVEGYASDISRTFVLGKATDKMKQVFDIVHQAQAAAVRTARPGLACEAVDAAARSVIEDAGYGPGYKHFTHRVGHGLGMDGHEWPYLVRGNKLPLQAGMTFSDEPGVYIRGEFGVRLEDDMVITAHGAELLTPQSPSIEDPF